MVFVSGKTYLLIIVFLLFVMTNIPNVMGQRPLAASGRVVDGKGNPIEGATVALVGDFHVIVDYTTNETGRFFVDRVVQDSAKVWILIEGQKPEGYWDPGYAFSLVPSYRNTKKFSGVLLGRTESGIIKLGDVLPTVNYRGVEIGLHEIFGRDLPDLDDYIPEIRLKIKSGSVMLREANPVPLSAIRNQKIKILLPDSPVTLEFTFSVSKKKRTVRKLL